MGDDIRVDQELERLRSMHKTVEKLRSQLKDLELDSYSVARNVQGHDQLDGLQDCDGVSNKYS